MCCDERLKTGNAQELHILRPHCNDNHLEAKPVGLNMGLRNVGKVNCRKSEGKSKRIFYAGPQAWRYILA
jgi:hypothetical protein